MQLYPYDAVIKVLLFFYAGPPMLLSKSDQIVRVNVSEEVVLNCSVSSSPDPVYSWSFPDSCSSCPNTSNDSVLIFTAEDVTDSGEYTCVAENQYGKLHKSLVCTSSVSHISIPYNYLCLKPQNQCCFIIFLYRFDM